MKYCAKCGSLIEEGATVCTECGASVNDNTQQSNASYQQTDANQQGYYSNAYQQPPYNPYYQQPDPLAKEIETANTLGIISLVFSLIGPILLTIAGLVTGIICTSKIKPLKNGEMFPNDQAKSAYNLGKAGMIISIVKLSLGFLAIIGWIVFVIVIGAGAIHEIF